MSRDAEGFSPRLPSRSGSLFGPKRLAERLLYWFFEAMLLATAVAFTWLAIGELGGWKGWVSAASAWLWLLGHKWYWGRANR